MIYEMLVVAGLVISIVLAVVALVYSQIVTKRFNEAAMFMESLEKDIMHMKQGNSVFVQTYKDDKAAAERQFMFFDDRITSNRKEIEALDTEFDKVRDAIADWSEAGKLAAKNEKDFNDGLNNLLNYQPGVIKKGEEK